MAQVQTLRSETRASESKFYHQRLAGSNKPNVCGSGPLPVRVDGRSTVPYDGEAAKNVYLTNNQAIVQLSTGEYVFGGKL